MSHKNAVTVLEQGLAVCVAHQIHDAPMRARMAEDAIRGALGFLADVGEAVPGEPAEAPEHTSPLSLQLVDGSMIDATELAQPGVVVGVLGVDFHLPPAALGTNALADDEIDEDPAPSLADGPCFNKEEIDMGAEVYLELVQIGSADLAGKVAAFFGIEATPTLAEPTKA